jgi:hypothetical protein
VALTDGADGDSRSDSVPRAISWLKSTPNLNLAIITVGSGIDQRVCRSFLDAAEEAGNQAMLVKASNQAEIAKAFENVAAAMEAGGVAEVL